MYDSNTARSRTGFLIRYAGVPILWASKLQTEISLSATEAEMIAMSTATRENIFLLRLIMDAKANSDLHIKINDSKLHCTVHEDNTGTLELAKEYRIRPRTKHINVKYWHFTIFMRKHKNLISFNWIPSTEQLADIFTKPLGEGLFHKFASIICGWFMGKPIAKARAI